MRDIEEWRPVVDWEGLYEVSSHGRVRSCRRVVLRSDGRTQTFAERIRKLQLMLDGRLAVHLCRDSKPHSLLVHRLVARAFLGDPEDGSEVCHGDGDPQNNRVENLRWDSRSGNMLDKLAHDTHNRGERHNMVKLREIDVREIRDLYAGGALQRDIAEKFGVTQQAVSRIIRRKIWGWMDAPLSAGGG